MSYLAVTKLSTYQHYKNRRPPWVKLYTSLLDVNHPLNRLPVSTRYLFDRMLLLAANYDNAIPNDSELLAKLLCMESRECREGIEELLQGRWIVERQTKRRASKPASKPASKSFAPEAEAEKERSKAVTVPRPEGKTAYQDNGHDLKALGDERYFEVARIVSALKDTDQGTHDVIAGYAAQLPVSVIADLRERAEQNGGKGPGWAIRALQDEIKTRMAVA